ncbi:MAG: hypothetical protein H6926_05695 [Chromatiales bacterium]|nr:hypothetical protein [Gammaproteobacteria bacterium]MCP5352662.1 hypothetical protein [Chromatiales bacterium]
MIPISRFRRPIAALLAAPLTWAALLVGGFLASIPLARAVDDEGRWYRIEVVIFEQRNLGDAAIEVWPVDPGMPDMAMVKDLENPPAGFSVSFRNNLELGGHAARLSRSGRYEPIMHFAWTQRGLDQRRAIPLRVKGGVIYPPLPVASPPERSPLLPVTPVTAGVDAGASGPKTATTFGIAPLTPVEPEVLYQLDGTLTLVLGRYLHLYTDLINRRLLAPGSLVFADGGAAPTYDNGQALASFRVREHRKMRSKELHYIDHPILGILVKATPVELPAGEPVAEPAIAPETAPSPTETTVAPSAD